MIQRNEEGFAKNQEWLRWLLALLFIGSKTKVTYAAIRRENILPTRVWLYTGERLDVWSRTYMLDIMVDHGRIAERRLWSIEWGNLRPTIKRICALRSGGDKWSC